MNTSLKVKNNTGKSVFTKVYPHQCAQNGHLRIQAAQHILIEARGDCRAARGIHCESRENAVSIYGKLTAGLDITPEALPRHPDTLDPATWPTVTLVIRCQVLTLYNRGRLTNQGCYQQRASAKRPRQTRKGGSLTVDTHRLWLSGKTRVYRGRITLGANHLIVLGLNQCHWAAFKREAKQVLTLQSVLRGQFIRMATPVYMKALRRVTTVGGSITVTALVQFIAVGYTMGLSSNWVCWS